MPLQANWSYPTDIRFGAGRIAELADLCQRHGMRNPLFVTDRGLVSNQVTAATLAVLDQAGLAHAVFADVDPNPNDHNLAAGLVAFAAGQHDGVIAFGGGSGLDLGKLIAFMAGQTRPVWDFEDVSDWWTRASVDGIAPIIAVPTTAGTGSEVGRAGVLTQLDTAQKKIIFHPRMLARAVICDPALTAGMPQAITAGTGLDAFAHCVEAFCSPHYHPMSQGMALEGMRLVKDNLPRAYANGDDLEARAHMMSAAIAGATAFQKGLGAIHALSHPIGAIYGTHHGTTNAVCMPAVLQFNRPAIESVIARAADYLDIEGGFDGFCDFVDSFNAALGIPSGLHALGIEHVDVARVVEAALRDPSVGGNPLPMTVANTTRLLEACCQGG